MRVLILGLVLACLWPGTLDAQGRRHEVIWQCAYIDPLYRAKDEDNPERTVLRRVNLQFEALGLACPGGDPDLEIADQIEAGSRHRQDWLDSGAKSYYEYMVIVEVWEFAEGRFDAVAILWPHYRTASAEIGDYFGRPSFLAWQRNLRGGTLAEFATDVVEAIIDQIEDNERQASRR
jgi:hypothetical protein